MGEPTAAELRTATAMMVDAANMLVQDKLRCLTHVVTGLMITQRIMIDSLARADGLDTQVLSELAHTAWASKFAEGQEERRKALTAAEQHRVDEATGAALFPIEDLLHRIGRPVPSDKLSRFQLPEWLQKIVDSRSE